MARARRGGSGALHPQSALAGLNSRSRGLALGVSTPVEGVDGQVPCVGRLRTRSDPGGSSLKQSRSSATGEPGRSPRPAGTPGNLLRSWVHGPHTEPLSCAHGLLKDSGQAAGESTSTRVSPPTVTLTPLVSGVPPRA